MDIHVAYSRDLQSSKHPMSPELHSLLPVVTAVFPPVTWVVTTVLVVVVILLWTRKWTVRYKDYPTI